MEVVSHVQFISHELTISEPVNLVVDFKKVVTLKMLVLFLREIKLFYCAVQCVVRHFGRRTKINLNNLVTMCVVD